MANPLTSASPSPLMNELVKRTMNQNQAVSKPAIPRLSQPVPKMKAPVQRPKKFVGSRPHTLMQRIL